MPLRALQGPEVSIVIVPGLATEMLMQARRLISVKQHEQLGRKLCHFEPIVHFCRFFS